MICRYIKHLELHTDYAVNKAVRVDQGLSTLAFPHSETALRDRDKLGKRFRATFVFDDKILSLPARYEAVEVERTVCRFYFIVTVPAG